MIVRPADVADRAAVLALAQHYAAAVVSPDAPYGPLLTVDGGRLPAIVDETLTEGIVLVVQLDPDETLGAFLSLVQRVHALSGERYVEGACLWVEPPYRNGLLTGWLLRHAEAWALAQGCAFVKMPAPIGTELAGYYGRCGYAPIETAFIKRVA